MLGKLIAKLIGSKEKKKPATKKKPAKKTSKAAAKKKTVSPKPKKGKTKRRKQAPSKKQPPSPVPSDKQIGEVVAFFRLPVVAVIKITQSSLTVGDKIWIHGHTTNLKQAIASMQINHQPIQEAKKGAEVGIKVSARARRGDRVYLLTT